MKLQYKKILLLAFGSIAILYAAMEAYYILLNEFSKNFQPNKNMVYAVTTPHHLAVIDTRTDKIIKKIDIGSSSHLNPTLDQAGNVYLSHYKQFLEAPGNDIIVYHPANNRVTRLTSHGYGPTSMVPIKVNSQKKLFVANYISKEVGRNTSSIAIFEGDNYHFKKNLVMDMHDSIFYSMMANITQDKIYALATYLGTGKNMYKDHLYVIDPVKEEVAEKILLPEGGSGSRIIETTNGKIFVGTGFKEIGTQASPPPADYLRVYNSKNFKFLKKIQLTEYIPSSIVYYPNLNKLYIQGYVDGYKDFHIDIIDTKTDTLIKTLFIEGAEGIHRASKDKLFININHVPDEQQGYKVLDVNKDEFVGFIPGKFGGVSDIPLEWVMDSH